MANLNSVQSQTRPVQKAPQTKAPVTGTQTNPTTAPATKPAATPSTTQSTTQTTPPKDQNGVTAQQGSAAGSVNLLEAAPEPLPPALLKLNDSSDTVAELNKLLKKIGVLAVPTRSFNAATEAAVKHFQKNNGLRESGQVDEKTLRKLIDSAKEDEGTYPKLEALVPDSDSPVDGDNDKPVAEAKPAEKVFANDYERVKDAVACQIADKCFNPETAFAIGSSLKDHAAKWDKKMPSSSMCYTAVKRAIEDAINIPYKVFGGKQYPGGGSAKTAGKYLLSKSPEFIRIDGLKRADLDNLPQGSVIVYKPRKGHGHIGVQDGAGHDISDKTRTQANVHRTADFEVYFPVAVREK